MALNLLAAHKIKAIYHTTKGFTHSLDYCATRLEVSMEYRHSNMIIYEFSDASYLSEWEEGIHVGR